MGDDELGEAEVRVRRGFFEEEFARVAFGVAEAAFAVVIGGSFLQVPACQPDSTVGSWGSLGAITDAVSAAARAGITAAEARAIPTQITKKVIQASPHAASLLQKSIPNQFYPKIDP
jgi:hypothetical protein